MNILPILALQNIKNIEMKKFIYIQLIFAFSLSTFASEENTKSLYFDSNPFYKYSYEDCDFCGCGSSGGGMGYGTVGNENFIGLRYIYQSYKSRDGIFNNSP